MFHHKELGDFATLLPCDLNGFLPEPGDDWRLMSWGLESLEACNADIIELLDDIWWPELVELATQVREKVRTMRE